MTGTPAVDTIIKLLKLEPLQGEGGLFRQTYLSPENIPSGALPGRYGGREKPFGTAIYYLLTNEVDSFSALHRLPTDEIYHFYLGDPLELTLLYPDGISKTVILGQDILNGEQLQATVPAGVWQGSRVKPGGKFSLAGTTMAPGFTPEDFEAGRRGDLLAAYPGEAEKISALTRE